MMSSKNKFRLATVGSLICVIGVGLLYKFKEEAAGKAAEVGQVPSRPASESEPAAPPAPSAESGVWNHPDRIEYTPPPMQLYPGPVYQTAATGESK
jgi:hypothetical protein